MPPPGTAPAPPRSPPRPQWPAVLPTPGWPARPHTGPTPQLFTAANCALPAALATRCWAWTVAWAACRTVWPVRSAILTALGAEFTGAFVRWRIARPWPLDLGTGGTTLWAATHSSLWPWDATPGHYPHYDLGWKVHHRYGAPPSAQTPLCLAPAQTLHGPLPFHRAVHLVASAGFLRLMYSRCRWAALRRRGDANSFQGIEPHQLPTAGRNVHPCLGAGRRRIRMGLQHVHTRVGLFRSTAPVSYPVPVCPPPAGRPPGRSPGRGRPRCPPAARLQRCLGAGPSSFLSQ